MYVNCSRPPHHGYEQFKFATIAVFRVGRAIYRMGHDILRKSNSETLDPLAWNDMVLKTWAHACVEHACTVPSVARYMYHDSTDHPPHRFNIFTSCIWCGAQDSTGCSVCECYQGSMRFRNEESKSKHENRLFEICGGTRTRCERPEEDVFGENFLAKIENCSRFPLPRELTRRVLSSLLSREWNTLLVEAHRSSNCRVC